MSDEGAVEVALGVSRDGMEQDAFILCGGRCRWRCIGLCAFSARQGLRKDAERGGFSLERHRRVQGRWWGRSGGCGGGDKDQDEEKEEANPAEEPTHALKGRETAKASDIVDIFGFSEQDRGALDGFGSRLGFGGFVRASKDEIDGDLGGFVVSCGVVFVVVV